MSRTPSLLALALAASALLVAPASAQTEPGSFEYRVPLKGLVVSGEASPETPAPAPVALLLRSATLESATVGQPYSFDFKSLLDLSGGNPTPPMSAVSWGASASLPSWLTLNPDTGVLSGTPTVKNEAGTDFEVIATHEDAEGRQVFTIVVNGVVLRVTQISAGDQHTCAVTTAGAAKCWGAGSNGRLGNGSAADSTTPVSVTGLGSGVTQISAGGYHTCAVTTSGAAKCWGMGSRLGNGGTSDSSTPVSVTGLDSGVTQISAGGSHSCAVQNGTAKCWGGGAQGRLGNGGTSDSTTPVNVTGLGSNVTQIGTGGQHSCAVHNGAAKCWGNGYGGVLGNGGTSNSATPVNVTGLGSGVTQIAAGAAHTCAVHAGVAKCWGSGGSGMLGHGSTGSSPTPVTVTGLDSSVTQISAGSNHTCAVTTSGAAKCWGWDYYGQLGNDTARTQHLTPVDVSGLSSGVTSISTGSYHTCAVTTSGAAKCWGRDAYGQLGDGGTNTDQPTPVDVLP